MKKKLRTLGSIAVLILAALSCNFERAINPNLPTDTPAVPGSVTLPPPAPTPTITPPPSPGARVETGDQALFYGDWERAINEYTLAFQSSADPEVQAAALLGLGRAHLKNGNLAAALESLSTAIGTYPNSSHRAAMFFALGEVYEELDRFPEALTSFQQYYNLRPGLIDHYVFERIGDLQVKTGDYLGAISTYQQAIQAPHLGNSLEINIKIGDAYVLMGDGQTALVIYQDVFARSGNDYQKAQMQRYIGYTSIQMGLTEQGYAAYRFAVENYPLAYDSYAALIALVDAGQAVNEFDRGLVDYHAGQYAVASAAFERYLASGATEYVSSALYYNGLCLQNTSQPEAAMIEFQKIINNHLNQPHWDDAFDELAFTQWYYLDQYEAAVQTYEDFVNRAPEHPRAPEFLYFAGRVAERGGDLNKAAQMWERLGIGYSTSQYAFDGFFQAGIARYRFGDYSGAVVQFQSALGLAANKEQQAQAHFWIGKGYSAIGDQNSANSAWQQAMELDPTGYYSERARDVLEFRLPFTPPASYNTAFNLEAERSEAETWLRLAFSLPEDTDFNDLASLQADPRFARGTEMWRLGLYNQARVEFESLRVDLLQDPVNTYRLASYLIDLGMYRSGIIAARQVLTLAGYDDAGTFRAPIYFNRLRFGFYYPEIVFPAADAYAFHPLFLYSVLRQESLFEGFVTSTAGARGLMQIIPSTGESIFIQNGWPPNYTTEDLYRPLISITYGADYLASQRDSLGGELYVALAAYNGGPGNAAAWRNLAGGDLDLFAEVVRFSETRRYIRSIYEQYTIYRNLYGVAP
ncbi:transglycosylase SLT domain-containing protein [Chloroflexota bacterium]